MSAAPVIVPVVLEAAARQHYVETDARDERVPWEVLPEHAREYHRMRVRGPLSAALAASQPVEEPRLAAVPRTTAPWPSPSERDGVLRVPRMPRMGVVWTRPAEGRGVTGEVQEVYVVESCEFTIGREDERWEYAMGGHHEGTTMTIIIT